VSTLRSRFSQLLAWFDSSQAKAVPGDRSIDWTRIVPFIGIHLACLGVFWVGASPLAIVLATVLYVVRMFAITGFYHRYFSHRAFSTSRPAQFLFALLGAMAVQRGPLWWAAHHRHHHAHSDRPADVHSPRQHGFLWSHVGWFLSRHHYEADLGRVKDLQRYPELRWLDRYDIAVPIALAVALYAVGAWLKTRVPGLHTSGGQLLVWGFFISTVVCYHATYTINSLAHVFGRRRYATPDDSRNNFLLALLTLGEGWHNNHHHYPNAAQQGFYWWEIDITYYVLRFLALLGLVWDLKPVPAVVREARRAVPRR
jgi:stearoyl-CoA desaturase (delta-9 desaturase)